jgi:lysyl-tRNA synthetase class 1
MFWADRAAEDIKKASGNKSQLVDDAKTPSGKVHVGALRGVIIHDLVHKSLIDKGVKSRYTYIFDDFDPMDDLPAYLPKEKYEKYMGVPLKDIPAPEGRGSYAKY